MSSFFFFKHEKKKSNKSSKTFPIKLSLGANIDSFATLLIRSAEDPHKDSKMDKGVCVCILKR